MLLESSMNVCFLYFFYLYYRQIDSFNSTVTLSIPFSVLNPGKDDSKEIRKGNHLQCVYKSKSFKIIWIKKPSKMKIKLKKTSKLHQIVLYTTVVRKVSMHIFLNGDICLLIRYFVICLYIHFCIHLIVYSIKHVILSFWCYTSQSLFEYQFHIFHFKQIIFPPHG